MRQQADNKKQAAAQLKQIR